jgi:hypothetical protein
LEQGEQKMSDNESNYYNFGGLKDDNDPKQTPPQYFNVCTNFNFPDDGGYGITKILMPKVIRTLSAKAIDGIFEYRYLSTGGTLTTEQIGVTDGKVYKDVLSASPILLKSGLTTGRVSFASYNDKLFIANGTNYVNIYYGSLGLVSEMGAPVAELLTTAGNVTVGTHSYKMTYVTSGGEEIIGSVSNEITATVTPKQQVKLYLPIGYAGVTDRKLYRTEAGGTTFKLLATIGNNTDLTYTDNIADASLTTAIGAVNNELPKPYFLAVANQCLYMTKVTKYPTQVFKTDTALEVIDSANYIDVANYGNDNTPVEGIGIDFNKVIVGTGRQVYIVEPPDATTGTSAVNPTRCNVGIKSGYSCVNVPSFEEFAGGLMFLSTLGDIRVLNGQTETTVVTTLNNVLTDNLSQNVKGSLITSLASYTNIASEFFNYRYHIAIDATKLVFDIRNKGWTKHYIKSATYLSTPNCFAVISGALYNGQLSGDIEKEYTEVQYKSEDVTASVKSAFLEVSRLFKWFKKLVFWTKTNSNSTTDFLVYTDSNLSYPTNAQLVLTGGEYDSTYFNSTYFNTSSSESDYRVINVTTPCRWAQWSATCVSGNINILQWGAVGQALANKEE